MPVDCAMNLKPLQEDIFREIDYIVTGCAFDTHNALGNLLKEDVYRDELLARLTAKGIGAVSEMGVTVSYESFRRRYSCDLIVEKGLLYETKAVRRLLGKHQEQVLHYLFLTELCNGKLLNFRETSLGKRYVSSRWSAGERRDIQVTGMSGCRSAYGKNLVALLLELLGDWGAGLKVGLYRDALIHLSSDLAMRPLRLQTGFGVTQTPMMPLLPDGGIFHLSTLREDKSRYDHNLRKWFHCFQAPSISWINLNGSKIEFMQLLP